MGCQHHLLVITLALLAAMEAPAVSSAAEASSGVPTTGQADTGAGASAEASSGAPANPSPDVSPAPSPGDTSAPSTIEQRKPSSDVPRVVPQPSPSVSYQSDDEGTGRLGEPVEQDDPLPSKAAARWMLTLDRISMVGTWSVMHTTENVEITESGTQAILAGGGATTGSSVPINPHATPRLTLERIIGSRFTLGLGASLYKHSGDWDAQSGGQSASGEGAKSWLVALFPTD